MTDQREQTLTIKELELWRVNLKEIHGWTPCGLTAIDCIIDAACQSISAGWMPIEIAPKDGTRVLLSGVNQGLRWEGIGCWYPCNMRWTDDGVLGPELREIVTHWQPLPAPPKEDKVAVEGEPTLSDLKCEPNGTYVQKPGMHANFVPGI